MCPWWDCTSGRCSIATTPDDHFTAARLLYDRIGQLARWRCLWRPKSVLGLLSPAVFNWLPSYPPQTTISTTASRPPCATSDSGRVGGAGRCPTIRARIVSSATVQVDIVYRCSKTHPRRSFHCQSTLPCDPSDSGRVGGACNCPTIRAGIVSPTVFKIAAAISTPDNHFTPAPPLPSDLPGQWARWWCW